MKYSLLFFLFLTLSSCFESKKNEAALVINNNDIAQEIQIPQKILKEIEADLLAESKLLTPVYIFIPIQVTLTEGSDLVLKSSPITFNFPKGGGLIDLKDVVTGQGSFYLNFPKEQFETLPELMHLYYISQAPVKKIDSEKFGLGCGKWIDIKNKFSQLQKPDFLKVNSTDQRYLHVLAGHYLFVFRNNNQIYLTQLSITDTRYSDKLCINTMGMQDERSR